MSYRNRSTPWLCLVVSVFAFGCLGSDEEQRRFDVGEEGRLKYWVRTGCGLQTECAPLQNPLPIGTPPSEALVAHTGDLLEEPLPELVFESEDPSVFTVLDLECNPMFDQGTRVTEPCDSAETIRVYVVNLDLHEEGRSDLIARTTDGELYDRSPIRVSGSSEE